MYTGIMKLCIPFNMPNRNLNTKMTEVLETIVMTLNVPITSAIRRHILFEYLYYKKYAPIAPTKQPKGNMPLRSERVYVFSSFVISLK